MCRRAAEAAFLGAIGSIGVFAVFEIETYFVETLLGDKVLAFGTKIAAVDYGVDELVGM